MVKVWMLSIVLMSLMLTSDGFETAEKKTQMESHLQQLQENFERIFDRTERELSLPSPCQTLVKLPYLSFSNKNAGRKFWYDQCLIDTKKRQQELNEVIQLLEKDQKVLESITGRNNETFVTPEDLERRTEEAWTHYVFLQQLSEETYRVLRVKYREIDEYIRQQNLKREKAEEKLDEYAQQEIWTITADQQFQFLLDTEKDIQNYQKATSEAVSALETAISNQQNIINQIVEQSSVGINNVQKERWDDQTIPEFISEESSLEHVNLMEQQTKETLQHWEKVAEDHSTILQDHESRVDETMRVLNEESRKTEEYVQRQKEWLESWENKKQLIQSASFRKALSGANFSEYVQRQKERMESWEVPNQSASIKTNTTLSDPDTSEAEHAQD